MKIIREGSTKQSMDLNTPILMLARVSKAHPREE